MKKYQTMYYIVKRGLQAAAVGLALLVAPPLPQAEANPAIGIMGGGAAVGGGAAGGLLGGAAAGGVAAGDLAMDAAVNHFIMNQIVTNSVVTNNILSHANNMSALQSASGLLMSGGNNSSLMVGSGNLSSGDYASVGQKVYIGLTDQYSDFIQRSQLKNFVNQLGGFEGLGILYLAVKNNPLFVEKAIALQNAREALAGRRFPPETTTLQTLEETLSSEPRRFRTPYRLPILPYAPESVNIDVDGTLQTYKFKPLDDWDREHGYRSSYASPDGQTVIYLDILGNNVDYSLDGGETTAGHSGATIGPAVEQAYKTKLAENREKSSRKKVAQELDRATKDDLPYIEEIVGCGTRRVIIDNKIASYSSQIANGGQAGTGGIPIWMPLSLLAVFAYSRRRR